MTELHKTHIDAITKETKDAQFLKYFKNSQYAYIINIGTSLLIH